MRPRLLDTRQPWQLPYTDELHSGAVAAVLDDETYLPPLVYARHAFATVSGVDDEVGVNFANVSCEEGLIYEIVEIW